MTAILLAAVIAFSPAMAADPASFGHGSAAAHSIRGTASWYAARPGHAAAGPALRHGHWRGTIVRVCAARRCVRVRLTDWCQCYGVRLIDLARADFARLADPRRGLVKVTVSR